MPENQKTVDGTDHAKATWVWHDVVAPFIATRLMLVTVAWLAMHLLQHQAVVGAWEISEEGRLQSVHSYVSATAKPLINMWSRWDAGWYLGIAKNGYSFVKGQPSNTAFYPLYPMLVRLAHYIVPSDSDAAWLGCGIVVANLSLLVALCYCHLLVRLDFDAATASRAVLYLLIFPTTCFFSAFYTESLFLAFVFPCFYYARINRWWLAGACGGAATLSRSAGILLLLPLAVEYFVQRRFDWRKARTDVLALALIPSALAVYSGYLRLRFGNSLAISDAQAAWGRILTPQWNTVIQFFQGRLAIHGGPHSIVDLAFTVAFLALAIGVTRKLRLSYAVYTLLAFLFITAWGTFISVPRYGLMIFPLFILLALLGKNPLFHRILVMYSAGLAAFFMIVFALWDWVA